MPKRTPPQQPQSANLTSDQMTAAIPKLERRLAELSELKPEQATSVSDPAFEAVELKIDSTLSEVFGPTSIEYGKYRIGDLYQGGYYVGGISPAEIRSGFGLGVTRATTTIRTIIELFKESLEASPESPSSKAVREMDGLSLHPRIKAAAERLFRDSHYANAVEDACKALDLLVKLHSGRDDLAGTELMQRAFSPKQPILRFNDGSSETDESEQQGMMFLYAGTMLAFRNPRAHGLLRDDPETALGMIAFVSLLAKALERPERT